ncbi:MAG TPA: diacylglycerol kinase family protein [Terriglobia bacterium]|nr:diacylglycerol kinase family protein [Terriglobia bacterium]
MARTVAILNPESARGRTKETWARVRTQLPGTIETLETRAPGHGIELTANAIKSGATTIIAVGGDGTINEVVNGFFENERLISNEATLGIIPRGTGSDFWRMLNLPPDERSAAAVIHTGAPRLIDIMRVRYTRMDGTSALRYSVNVTSFGMGGLVAARANRSSKPLGGNIAFLFATIRTAQAFAGNSVTLRLDDSTTVEAKITNVAVGNGQYHGAGMWICPGASVEDGMVDLTVIHYLSLWELVKGLPVLYNGGIYSHPRVESYRAKRVQADSRDTTLIEIDGEPLGRLPIEVSILPQAIRVLMP